MIWQLESDLTHDYAWVDKVFSDEECEKIIQYAKSLNKVHMGSVGNDNSLTPTNTVNYEIRKNKVVWIDPNEDSAWIYQRISNIVKDMNEKYFKFDLIGFADPIQFTKYDAPDNKYQKHIDKWFGGKVRKLSIVVQLSDPKDYEGGELQLYTSYSPSVMNKEKGTLILFPSYTLHEVMPLTKGTRFSLVSWIGGKPFK
jgi:PKHD-type hydroxylase